MIVYKRICLTLIMMSMFACSKNEHNHESNSIKSGLINEDLKMALPDLMPGEKYEIVRNKLLKEGWQPIISAGADKCTPSDKRCQGRPEMEACSGSGEAPCLFKWKKGNTIASIGTIGEVIAIYAGSSIAIDKNIKIHDTISENSNDISNKISIESDPSPEYGNNMIAFNPKRQPNRTSYNDKYWNCSGIVSPKLRMMFHDEIDLIATKNNFQSPNKDLCEFGIVVIMGHDTYIIKQYASSEDRDLCISGGVCKNMYSLNFINYKDHNGNLKIARSYTLIGPSGTSRDIAKACISNDGIVLSANNNCMEINLQNK